MVSPTLSKTDPGTSQRGRHTGHPTQNLHSSAPNTARLDQDLAVLKEGFLRERVDKTFEDSS